MSRSVEEAFERMVHTCKEPSEECEKALDEFLEEACRETGGCQQRGSGRKRYRKPGGYSWVEEVISRGVPDGRSRLILYVLSRYLLNVRRLSLEEAEAVIDDFLKASCANHGNCSKIYKSWVRGVLRRVSEGGWMPWSLERIRREDPELYNVLKSVGLASGGDR
ncbi:MAG: DNA primase noncatalytic subunit PriX [Aeropyrum sp.]|nr:DNA primase noncatalytic subunit PriX [Aeropyrum sp.]MCE4616551.1 DNA primase noncatalytic subunit PriX [Aeropyrum sp.]